MRKRFNLLLRLVMWLYSPPVPAVDIGGALLCVGWAVALLVDPMFLALPSYRSLGLVAPLHLAILMGLLAAGHVFSILRPRFRVWVCIAAGGVWSTAAIGFGMAGAWTGLVCYAVLGAGSFLAALYAEIFTREAA